MTQRDQPANSKLAARRIGYGAAAAVQAVVLMVVNNVVEWDWFSWLTDDFNDVVGILSIAIVVSMLINLCYLTFPTAYGVRWFRAMCAAVSVAVSLAATVRVYQVFPFDFAGFGFNWEAVTRTILIALMAAMAIGLVFHVVQFVIGVTTSDESSETPNHLVHN